MPRLLFSTQAEWPYAVAGDMVDTVPLIPDVRAFGIAEQQGNGPNARQSDECVNHTAKHRAGSTKHPCDQIKLKQAHKPPVKGAYDNEHQ